MSDFVDEHAAEIDRAAVRIHPYIRRTPAVTSDLGDAVLKLENLQVTGSFKVRGAFNAILRLVESGKPVTGIAASSSGNHAQAVALAARTVGLPAAIVMPEDSNPVKIAATQRLGAEVITEGITPVNREDGLLELAAERGYEIVHAFDNWDVIHGQGTSTVELLDDVPAITTLIVPIGGGGQISGAAIAARGRDRGIRVIGAEPALADDAAQSLREGRIVTKVPGPTLADGARALHLGEKSFEVIVENHLVDDIVTVTESQLEDATRRAFLTAHIVAEPTGVLALAAWLNDLVPKRGEEVYGIVISGGNVDPAWLGKLLA